MAFNRRLPDRHLARSSIGTDAGLRGGTARFGQLRCANIRNKRVSHPTYPCNLPVRKLRPLRKRQFNRNTVTVADIGTKTGGTAYGRQLIDGADAVKSLPDEMSTIVDNHGQARELAKVPEEKRVEVLQTAVWQGECERRAFARYGLTGSVLTIGRELWVSKRNPPPAQPAGG